MKKYFILLAIIIPAISFAQNVAVNTDASQPDNSAMLDIKSNTKGLLVPRMTTVERSSIPGPALGLTVFDINTASYWMYRGDINGGWTEMQHSFQNSWEVSGLNIYNKNNGNVGIGNNNPTEKLSINGTNPALQMMNGGIAKGYMQSNGSDMKLGTYFNNTTGNIVFNTRATDRMWIDENGKVGIGTATPTSLLTVNGTNPWIEMQNNGVDKGFLQALGNDLKLGTNSTNTTGNLVFQTKLLDRMLIDENGMVGIGTSTTTSALTINGTNPVLQIRNADVDKGFIQLVDDDMKIGTNLSNPGGRFILRTNGADRLFVNSNGNVGIGAESFNYKLDVIGDARITNDLFVDGVIKSENIEINSSAPYLEIKTTNNSTSGIIKIDNSNNVVFGKGFYGGALVLDGSIGTSTKRFYMSKANQFNIGTGINASGYTLSVEGKVIATDFTTSSIANWPDYVFENKYKLMPLADVRKFINENKHLPNIPSAKQIEKEGIQLGDMSKRLMEKVEELTLYILDLQDQLDKIRKDK